MVFTSRHQMRLRPEAFARARSLAAKVIDPPERGWLTDDAPMRRHELLYRMVAEEEVALEDCEHTYDRMLAETVVLHRLLMIEQDLEPRTYSIARTVAVLGCMIQERLTILLLNVRADQFQQLFDIGSYWGMNRNDWDARLAGASAEAKAIQELTNIEGVKVYMSSIWEDSNWRIDLFVELENTDIGACVSVKLNVGKRTNFWLTANELPRDDKIQRSWEQIERGTRTFNSKTRRNWIPVLLMIGKKRGKPVDTRHYARTAPWARALHQALCAANADARASA